MTNAKLVNGGTYTGQATVNPLVDGRFVYVPNGTECDDGDIYTGEIVDGLPTGSRTTW